MATIHRKHLAMALALAAAATPQSLAPAPEVQRALASISSNSLRGNLSFLASTLLEGRDTPSPGLDVAAEYIAAQFRKAGVQPAGDGYFQKAKMLRVTPTDRIDLRIEEKGRTLPISRDQVLVVSRQPMELSSAPVYKAGDGVALKRAEVQGKVIVLQGRAETARAVAKAAAALGPAAFLETAGGDRQKVEQRLIEADEAVFGRIPRLIVNDNEAAQWIAAAKDGETGITVSLHLRTATAAAVTVRNVAAWLRGSDPLLRNQYVLLTAHYDHVGRDMEGAVCPGANDDGSGTVSVVEIAQALAAMPVHPKRSIVFVLFFGEEEGDLGSRYYARHPLFPLAATVADLNLEQIGRTDSNAGPEISNATLTGYRYSNVAHTLEEAGRLTGVKVYETPDSDEFFERSDNETFAEYGIPAHTLVVAFEFPDYHQPGDVWEKIDYGNMAKVDRMIAMGTVLLADNPERPRWNNNNPHAARYREDRAAR